MRSKYAKALVLPRGRDREIEKEERRLGMWQNLFPRLSSTRGRVIASSLDLFKKYYRHVHSSKLLGTRQISSLGFKGLTRTALTLLIAS